jgi:hypothetical protein
MTYSRKNKGKKNKQKFNQFHKYMLLTSPRNMAERMTEKKGSIALIVCVNDTATFPRLIFVKRFPKVCTTASGNIAASCKQIT